MMSAARVFAACVALASVARLTRAQTAIPSPAGPAGKSVLAGYVRDDLGHPIALVTLIEQVSKLSTTTDDSGYFRLREIPPGPGMFTAMRIGYSPLSFTVTLPADSAVNTEIHLHATVNLEKMTVTDKATPAGLTKVGFTERQRLGFGSFLTPDMIDREPISSSPAALLRQTPGLTVTCPRRQGGGCAVAAQNCITLWVDGARDPIEIRDMDDDLTRSAIYAMEVYPHPVQVPPRFQSSQKGSACGAIVVWTTLKAR